MNLAPSPRRSGQQVDRKFILNFTPTGMIPDKAMTAHVPLLPHEIAAQISEVAELGVNMVHLHARDPISGRPAYQKELYAETIERIKARHNDLVVCVSTSGREFSEFEKRSECLDLDGDLKRDFASLTLSSLNFSKQASVNSPDMVCSLARKMQDRGIKPELEVFDLGMINYAKYLIQKGWISPPYYFNIILGNIASAQATMSTLGLMIQELPDDSVWSVGGIGDCQLPMNIMGLVAGGGVRVGLEDNIWFDQQRTQLATNRGLIERILAFAAALDRCPFTPAEARAKLSV